MSALSGDKVYVGVVAAFRGDGMITPRQIIWEDGRRFDIDRVSDVRPAAAMKAGGSGDRYTVWINGARRYLFFERSAAISGSNIGRWFIERR